MNRGVVLKFVNGFVVVSRTPNSELEQEAAHFINEYKPQLEVLINCGIDTKTIRRLEFQRYRVESGNVSDDDQPGDTWAALMDAIEQDIEDAKLSAQEDQPALETET